MMLIWFNIAEGFVTFNETQVTSWAGASRTEVALCLRTESKSPLSWAGDNCWRASTERMTGSLWGQLCVKWVCLASRRPAATVQIYVYRIIIFENNRISFIRTAGDSDSVQTTQGRREGQCHRSHQGCTQGRRAPSQQQHQIAVWNTQFRDTMIWNILRDLAFSQNQPLKSAGEWYIATCVL